MRNPFNTKTCRKFSGIGFLTGNLTLLVTNLTDPNWFQLISAIVFCSGSAALLLSNYHHRWLFWCSGAVITGYALVALSGTGSGTTLQYLGFIPGFTGGLLLLRAAWQRENGKQFPLPYPFNLVDLYPLASCGLIEGTGCVLTFFGALMNGDLRLALVTVLWITSYSLLILSDEFLFKPRP
jgi:hypothetical protein